MGLPSAVDQSEPLHMHMHSANARLHQTQDGSGKAIAKEISRVLQSHSAWQMLKACHRPFRRQTPAPATAGQAHVLRFIWGSRHICWIGWIPTTFNWQQCSASTITEKDYQHLAFCYSNHIDETATGVTVFLQVLRDSMGGPVVDVIFMSDDADVWLLTMQDKMV